MLSYLALFSSAFIAATLFPLQSEVVLIALIDEGKPKFSLWLIATLGNTLGAWVNWVLGRYLLHFQDRRWFPFKLESLSKTQQWFLRYGQWSLLFAWLPIVGDGLTFIAGIMRVRAWVLLLLCAVGKGARYAVIMGVVGAIL